MLRRIPAVLLVSAAGLTSALAWPSAAHTNTSAPHPVDAVVWEHQNALPPPPPPATPPPAQAVALATSSWQALVMSLPWNGQLMLHVVQCESGGDPTAQNSSSSAHGLFQQLGESTNDPMQQVRDAFALWQAQGYAAWAASRSCW